MPINLKGYEGKYVEIVYGSIILSGRLVGNTLRNEDDTWKLNVQAINAVRDITKEVYDSLRDSESLALRRLENAREENDKRPDEYRLTYESEYVRKLRNKYESIKKQREEAGEVLRRK